MREQVTKAGAGAGATLTSGGQGGLLRSNI